MQCYIDSALIDHFVINTNLYAAARQAAAGVNTTTEEMWRYLAVRIRQGIVVLPELTQYWAEGYRDQYVSQLMASKRFFQLHRYFHIEPPVDSGVRQTVVEKTKFYHQCQLLFKHFYMPGRNFAVNETMIRFQGRSHWITVIKNKPVPVGYKLYTVASDGYLLDFRIFRGKGPHTHTHHTHTKSHPQHSLILHPTLPIPHSFLHSLSLARLPTHVLSQHDSSSVYDHFGSAHATGDRSERRVRGWVRNRRPVLVYGVLWLGGGRREQPPHGRHVLCHQRLHSLQERHAAVHLCHRPSHGHAVHLCTEGSCGIVAASGFGVGDGASGTPCASRCDRRQGVRRSWTAYGGAAAGAQRPGPSGRAVHRYDMYNTLL